MKRPLYSIRDSKADGFMSIFASDNDQVAMRTVSIAANEPNSLLNAHSQDYTLIHIGDFDNVSGQLFDNVNNRYVCTVSQLVKRPIHQQLKEGVQDVSKDDKSDS